MKYLIFVLLIFSNTNYLESGEWKLVDDPFGIRENGYQKIDCFDTNNCIAVYWYNLDRLADRITTDGGKTWFTTIYDTEPTWEERQDLRLSQFRHRPNDVQFLDSNIIIITCMDGTYWITRNKGLNWEISQFDTLPIYASFYNEKYGALMDWNYIYLTNDGGYSYKNIHYTNIDSTRHVGPKIFMPDSNIIFITGYIHAFPFFYRSFDFGETWDKTPMPIPGSPADLYFFNKNDGIIIRSPETSHDIIYSTNDAGESWQKRLDTLNKFPVSAFFLLEVDFADDSNGIVLGKLFRMYRTNDRGINWIQDTSFYNQRPPNNESLISLSYPSKEFVFGVGYNGNIYKYEETATEVSEFVVSENISFNVFPNPSMNIINFSYRIESAGIINIYLTDILGNQTLLKSEYKFPGDYVETFNLNVYPQGIYNIVLQSGNTIYNDRIILIR